MMAYIDNNILSRVCYLFFLSFFVYIKQQIHIVKYRYTVYETLTKIYYLL